MSAVWFKCDRCGARFGIDGTSTGSDEDLAADEGYASEVEYHQSGQCIPVLQEAEPLPDPRAEYIAGLRAIADALEADDSLPLPYAGSGSAMLIFTYDKVALQSWSRVMTGRRDKKVSADRSFGFELHGNVAGVQVQILADRSEVCERVVKGTHEVEREVVVVPAETKTVTVTVDIVEWVCSPLLAEVSP